MAKPLKSKTNDAKQIETIHPDNLQHVCQYAVRPCPKCCYLRGVRDAS